MPMRTMTTTLLLMVYASIDEQQDSFECQIDWSEIGIEAAVIGVVCSLLHSLRGWSVGIAVVVRESIPLLLTLPFYGTQTFDVYCGIWYVTVCHALRLDYCSYCTSAVNASVRYVISGYRSAMGSHYCSAVNLEVDCDTAVT